MNGLREVRVVCFDAVGTLIHPDPPARAVYAEVGRRFGSRLSAADIRLRFAAAYQREEAFDRRHGLQTSEAREVERWRNIVAAVFDDVADTGICFRELFEHFSRPQVWRCDPDTATTLTELAQRGFVLGLASNYDSRLRRVAAGLPALAPVQHVVVSSEVGWRKPAPQFFTSLCAIAGVPAAQVLHVGDDRANDYDGARAAGLQAVLFNPQAQETESTTIRRLNDLLPRLQHHLPRG